VRIVLKGIHTVKAKGKTYHYAYRGGPRLEGEPGTAAFIESYQKAHRELRKAPEGTLAALIAAYKTSTDFTRRTPQTKKSYLHYLKLIEAEFGDLPITALSDPKVRGVFKAWRDGMQETPRKADLAWTILRRVLSVAKDRGQITINPCEKGGRLYKANRAEKIWTEDHIARFTAVAPPHLILALELALWTGQRQGDLLKLCWTDYRNGRLHVFQEKTKTHVVIPVATSLATSLDAAPRSASTILVGGLGKPLTSAGFRTLWRIACNKADIHDVTFHDLRGTAVTRLALAGCSVPEIAAITGHSPAEADSILKAHYLGGRNALAESAIAKLNAVKPTVKPDVVLLLSPSYSRDNPQPNA
jgi:integrase